MIPSSRALDLVMSELQGENSLNFIFLKEGKDPDDIINSKNQTYSFESLLNNKQRLIESSNKPVLATLVLNFLEKSEQNIRAAAKVKGRSYKNIISASNDGLSMKSIGPALISALDEASLNAAAANTPSGPPPIPI